MKTYNERSPHLGGNLALLGVMIPTAYLAVRLFSKPTLKRGTKHFVRDAGPDNMHAPPHRWDVVDQTADESFPASDPPGNY